MKLIVWNSQGAKWDVFWQHYLPAAGGDDVVGLLVESGWAPWVTPGEVTINAEYWCMSDVTWYSAKGAGKSDFCKGVESKRSTKAIWIPWVRNLKAFTNTRCSMGGALLPARLQMGQTDSFKVEGFIRPVIRVTLGVGTTGGTATPIFTILLVHMVSGSPKKAQNLLTDMLREVAGLIPQGTAAIIVGDMNVNIQPPANFPLLEKWRFVRTEVPTQQLGGELDYGLLFDPSQQLGAATATVIEQYKTGNNGSDHSVLSYDIPLK